MSYKPYFDTVNFNAVDTLYSGVSSLPFTSFGDYFSNISLFMPAACSYLPKYMPRYNFGTVGYSYSFDFNSSSSYSSSQSSLNSSSSYKFGSLTSSYSPAAAQPTVRLASERTSYKPVSRKAKGNLGPEFLAKVKQVAQNINCDYKDLLAVMNSESGLDPSIQNLAGYEAYGLIQFTKAAAEDIGTTLPALVRMSAVEQLDYVEKFYLKARKTRGFGNKKFTAADLYAITFLPARANQNVLCVKGERWESGRKKGQLKNWYEANTGFDRNGDKKIEKWELQERMNACRVNENIFMA